MLQASEKASVPDVGSVYRTPQHFEKKLIVSSSPERLSRPFLKSVCVYGSGEGGSIPLCF